MRKRDTTRRLFKPIVSALCIVLTTASHAFANNAPGPLAVLSMFSLVILLVTLTFAGGGYGVLKRLNDAKYPSKVKRTFMTILEFIAGIVLFIVGVMASIFGIVVLSLFAIGRGVKMLQWARETEKEGTQPAHLERANPKKLKISGIMLIILTLLVFGNSILNIEDVMGLGDYLRRGHASELNNAATNAHSAAKAYFKAHPKTNIVTCEDVAKAGYIPSPNVTCFSDMTATSGSIRMTGPAKWKLTYPVSVITYDGKFTPAVR